MQRQEKIQFGDLGEDLMDTVKVGQEIPDILSEDGNKPEEKT